MTVSLNLINGFTGQFSIGHAGFMCIGADTSAYFTTILFKVSTMSYLHQSLLQRKMSLKWFLNYLTHVTGQRQES